MYLNKYSVRIPEGNEVQGGYVEIDHDQHYRLVLRNDNASRCDARVEVDGKYAGTWRINDHSGITLERPSNDDGYFTAYIAGTPEARQAGIDYGNPDLGLVRVIFTPERERAVETFSRSIVGTPQWDNAAAASSSATPTTRSFYSHTLESRTPTPKGAPVGTGLSGHSSQKFHTVSQMELDYSRQVTINLRLVGRSDSPRPLVDASSNPVPPRIY